MPKATSGSKGRKYTTTNSNSKQRPRVKKGTSSGKGSKIKPEMWRDSFAYRAEYFKTNPGLLNKIWFCGICGGPIYGKENVQVDHIFPPSKVSRKKYNRQGDMVKNSSIFAKALNTRLNLVAAHATCNREKSDKVSARYLVTGFGTKAVSGTIYAASTVATASVYLGLKGVHSVGAYGVKKFQKSGKLGKAGMGLILVLILMKLFGK